MTEVEANWKILIENYNECLHCPTVHPELVAVVPGFRKGGVYEKDRGDGGVALADGGNELHADGRSQLPVMPGLDDARRDTRSTAAPSSRTCSST